MRVLVVTRWPKQRLLLTGEDASTLSVLIAKSGGAQELHGSMGTPCPMNRKWAPTLQVGEPKSHSWITLHCHSKKKTQVLGLPSFFMARETTERKRLATLRGNYQTWEEHRRAKSHGRLHNHMASNAGVEGEAQRTTYTSSLSPKLTPTRWSWGQSCWVLVRKLLFCPQTMPLDGGSAHSPKRTSKHIKRSHQRRCHIHRKKPQSWQDGGLGEHKQK